MCLILLFLFVIEACFSPNPPPVFVVGLLGVVQVTFPTYRYVHTESDAHVRVSELVVRIRGRKKVHVRVCWWTDGVVRADALRVVVLHVTVGALQQIYIFFIKIVYFFTYLQCLMAKFKEKKTVKYNIINTNITNKTQLILLQAFHFVKHVKL